LYSSAPKVASKDEFKTKHSARVWKVISIENDTKYVTCSEDKSIHVYNAQNKQLLKKLEGHVATILDILMLSNNMLASGSRDNTIKLWNITEGTCLHTLQGHTGRIRCLAEAKKSILISGSYDKTIRFWNLNNISSASSPIKIVQDNNQLEVGFHSLCLIDENNFAIGSLNDINIYKMSFNEGFNVECTKKLQGHTNLVNSTKITRSKEILISVSDDKTCKAWSISSGQCLRSFADHTTQIDALLVLTDSVFVTSSKEIKIWNLASESCIKTIQQSDKEINHLEMTKDSRILTCGDDRKIRIYNF